MANGNGNGSVSFAGRIVPLLAAGIVALLTIAATDLLDSDDRLDDRIDDLREDTAAMRERLARIEVLLQAMRVDRGQSGDLDRKDLRP